MAAIDLPELRGKLRLDLSELTRAPAQVRAAILRMQAAANRDPITVPLKVDEASIPARVRAARRKAQTDANRDPVEIKIRVDRAQLEAVAQRIRDLRTVFSATLGPIRALSTQLAGLAVRAGAVSAVLLGGAGLVGGVLAFAAAATQAAGAAPLLVAGLGAAGVVLNTLKVGVSGVGDAIDKSLKKSFTDLAPEADRFVSAVKRIAPELLRVRNAIQGRLFAGLAEQVRPLAERYLPQLRTAGVAIAATFNGVLRTAITGLNTSAAQTRIGTILDSARTAASALAPVLSRIPDVLARVAAAAGPAFTALAERASTALSRVFDGVTFAAQNGDLSEIIGNAIGVIRDLGTVLGSVLRIVGNLGKAARDVFGDNFTSPVAAAAKTLANLSASIPGQDAIRSVFATAAPVLAQIGRLLVNEVLPGLAGLLPVAAGLATAFLTGLAPVIPVAAKLAATLGTALTAVLPAVSTVAVALGGALTAAIRTLQPVIPPLASALSSLLSPTGVLNAALSALAPVLPILATGLGQVIASISGGLIAGLSALAPVLPGLAQSFADFSAAVAGGLARTLGDLAPLLPQLAVVLTRVLDAATPLVPVITGLLAPFLGLLQLRGVGTVLASVAVGFIAVKGALAIGGLVTSVGATVTSLRGKFQLLQGTLGLLGPTGNRAALGLGLVAKSLVIGGGVLIGLETAGLLLRKLQDAAFGAVPGVEQVKGALLQLSTDGGSLGSTLPNLGRDLEFLGAQVRRLADPSLGDSVAKTFTNVFTLGKVDPGKLRDAQQNLAALDQALTGLVQSGNGEQARAAFEQIASAAAKGGASVDQVTRALPGYRDALAAVANTATLSAKPVSDLQQVAQSLGVKFTEGATAADVLKASIDRLNGASISGLEADIAFRSSKDAVTQSVVTNGKVLDLNSAAGRSNTSALLAGIRAAQTHAQAVTDSTAKTQGQAAAVRAGTATFGAHIAQLRATAVAAGLNAKEVDALIRTYGRVPPKVQTAVELAIAKAEAAAVRIRAQISAVKGKTVSIVVSQTGSIQRIQREIDSLTGKAVSITVGLVRTGITARAIGGPVKARRPYLVGEEGPELIAPDSDGRVLTARETASLLSRSRRTGGTGGDAGGGGSVELGPNTIRALASLLTVAVAVEGVAAKVDRTLGGRFVAEVR